MKFQTALFDMFALLTLLVKVEKCCRMHSTHHETKSLTLMLRVQRSQQLRSNAAAVCLFNYNYMCVGYILC